MTITSLLNWEENIPVITQANSETKQEQIHALMIADGNTILRLISSALQILLLISLYVHFRLGDFFFFHATPYFPMVFVIKSLQSRLKLIWALVLPLSFIIITCYIHDFL